MKSYHSLTDDLISMSKLTIQIVCFGDLFPSINFRVLNKMNVRTESCPFMGVQNPNAMQAVNQAQPIWNRSWRRFQPSSLLDNSGTWLAQTFLQRQPIQMPQSNWGDIPCCCAKKCTLYEIVAKSEVVPTLIIRSLLLQLLVQSFIILFSC